MGISRREVELLIDDTSRDLAAFSGAFDKIMARVHEREAEDKLEDFADWPGTKAALNVLIMARTRCEGLLQDFRNYLEKMPRPALELVEEDDDDGNRR